MKKVCVGSPLLSYHREGLFFFFGRWKLCVVIVNKEEAGGDASTLQMGKGGGSLKSSWSASIALQILLYPLCQDATAGNLKDDVILNPTTRGTALTMPPNYKEEFIRNPSRSPFNYDR